MSSLKKKIQLIKDKIKVLDNDHKRGFDRYLEEQYNYSLEKDLIYINGRISGLQIALGIIENKGDTNND